jgi:glycosyltransferase involved in cell wall biosynthesis
MFKTIVNATGLNPVFIHSKPFSDNSKLYDDIDLLICTSSDEAGPLGILEAASIGIPVLSTKVGNLVELESIKFFETAEEAAMLIKNFLDKPTELIEYVNSVTKEVREKFNWEVLVEKYWSKII